MPKLEDGPKSNPSLGKIAAGLERQQTIPKEKCPIEVSFDLRKKEPGESVTAVVKNKANFGKKPADEKTFALKFKGAIPKL